MGKNAGCNCLGFKSASEVAIKRYNVLVPEMFPASEPDYKKALPNGVQKKIKKLGEYLDKYPERSEKVSRRLERRMRKDLPHERLGHTKISAYAYVHLLKAGPSVAARFAKELFGDDDDDLSTAPVIPALLKHPAPELSIWGLDILAQFTRVQVDSRYHYRIEEYLDSMCMLAVEDPPSAPPATAAQLHDAALVALGELLKLNGRTMAVPPYMDRVVECALVNFRHQQQPGAGTPLPDADDMFEDAREDPSGESEDPDASALMPDGRSKSPVRPLGGGYSDDSGDPPEERQASPFNSTPLKTKVQNSLAKVKTLMLDRRGRGGKEPEQKQDQALALLEEIAEYSQDSSTRRRVLECTFSFLDTWQHWSTPDRVEACVSIFRRSCTEDHQFFVIFSSLIRHLSSQRLTVVDRATLIKFAAAEGELQQSSFASPCLVFALSELPAYLPHPADTADKKYLESSIMQCIRRLAAAMGDSGLILEAVNGLLDRLSHFSTMATASLQCISAAVEVVPIKEKATSEALLQFPEALLRELLVVISTWPELEARSQAHLILQTLLSPSCSELDKTQMLDLLSAVWHQLMQPSAEPQAFALVTGSLMAALDSSTMAEVQLSALPFAVALQQRSLFPSEGNPSLGPGQRLAGLLVADLVLQKLAQLLPCPGLRGLGMNVHAAARGFKNDVEVDPPFAIVATEETFSAGKLGDAHALLDTMRSMAAGSGSSPTPSPRGDVSAEAAEALSAASIAIPSWFPKARHWSAWEPRPLPVKPADRSAHSFSTQTRRSGTFSDRHAKPSDSVLRELQANFASLAVTQEDVLVTGAVGVGSLVEAAKGAAMEAELAASREKGKASPRRHYGDMIQAMDVEIEISDL